MSERFVPFLIVFCKDREFGIAIGGATAPVRTARFGKDCYAALAYFLNRDRYAWGVSP
jgi:hypothetical protein